MIITVEDILSFLGIESNTKNCDMEINKFTSISALEDGAVSFLTKKDFVFDSTKKALVIACNNTIDENNKAIVVYSKNPRLDFIRVLNRFFLVNKKNIISSTVIIGNNVTIGNNVAIGEYSVIGDNVKIGDNTVINNHVVVAENTIIGKKCYIKSGAIIGEDGFGFERDEYGRPIRFPHFGNVVIGNEVEIGAKTIIARGALNSTIISDNTKIDDSVFIAHNVKIGKNTMIAACSETSGSSKIGNNCWIGPNSTIRDGVSIGDGSFLGIACIISNDILPNSKMGNISNLSFRDIVKINKIIGKQ
ncbi:UDP-3-O-(3-hydroxymyristoyl)glucosamine N-acyltransferase [Campylobacter concisus]